MEVTTVSHAGIANRIKNILSAMSQYDKVNTLYETINYIFPSLELQQDPVKTYDENWRLHIQDDEQKYNEEYKTIDLLYEKTPQYFIDKYLKVISRLDINPDIIEYVDDFTKDWKDMVGVHIRSWYCEKQKFHSNEIFEKEINKLNPDQKFFFCSDNSDVQLHFLKKYKDRLIVYNRQMYNTPNMAESGHHDDVQLTTDAFIELLILSRCSTIIGTYLSTFDEIAWWLSQCKSKVIIPKPITFDQAYHDTQCIKNES